MSKVIAGILATVLLFSLTGCENLYELKEERNGQWVTVGKFTDLCPCLRDNGTVKLTDGTMYQPTGRFRIERVK